MKLGIDFKAVATKAAGHTGGAVIAANLLNSDFIKKLGEKDGVAVSTKAIYPALATALIGYIGMPLLAKKMKMGGKKGDLLEALGEGCGMVGILKVADAQFPKLGVPKISGVDGYEENPYAGLADSLTGYEENPILSGADEDPFLED